MRMNDFNWKSRWSGRRLQRHPGRRRRPQSRGLGGDALFLPQTREKFRALTNLGLTDAIRASATTRGLYTFWDYQAGAWQKNNGIRIDHCCCRRRPPTG